MRYIASLILALCFVTLADASGARRFRSVERVERRVEVRVEKVYVERPTLIERVERVYVPRQSLRIERLEVDDYCVPTQSFRLRSSFRRY